MIFTDRNNINTLMHCMILICILIYGFTDAVSSETSRITVIQSTDSAQLPYSRISRSIAAVLQKSGAAALIIEEKSLKVKNGFRDNVTAKKPDLIVTVGRSATLAAIRNVRDIPIIYCADIDKSSIDASSNPDINGVTMQIPTWKQIEVMKEAFPGLEKVGCVYSSLDNDFFRSAGEIDLTFVDRLIDNVEGAPEAIKEIIREIASGNYFAPFFSADGKELCFSNQQRDFKETYIESVNLKDMSRSILLEHATHGCWSHNGRYLSYTITSTRELAVLDTETNDVRILAAPKHNYYFHCFTPDDRYIITTLHDEENKESLFRIPVQGGEPEQLTFHEGNHWFPSISPDGKWILYTVSYFPMPAWGKKTALFVYNTETGKSAPVFPESNENHHIGAITPDGKQFVYIRGNYGSNVQVFIADVDFGNERSDGEVNYGTQLIPGDFTKWLLSISPDGEWIGYLKDRKPHVLHVKSGKEKKITLEGILWMPPNALVFENRFLENRFEKMILDECMKSKVPVVAGSEKAVKSGSTMALGIDYEDMGKQAAGLALKRLAGGASPVPETETPRKVLIYINESAASSIGVTFPKSILEKAVMVGQEEDEDSEMFPFPR